MTITNDNVFKDLPGLDEENEEGEYVQPCGICGYPIAPCDCDACKEGTGPLFYHVRLPQYVSETDGHFAEPVK